MLETVDSTKLADKLNKAVQAAEREPLAVMIQVQYCNQLTPDPTQFTAVVVKKKDIFSQVNTSGEESKYGVGPSEAVPLARHVATQCPHLRLAGLMTIGMPDYSSRPECFNCLVACREEVAK